MARYITTIGNFDGIHLGHQKLLNDLKSIAKVKGFKTRLVTFSPYPFEFFKHGKKRILSTKDKIDFLNSIGIEKVVEIRFDERFRKLSPEDFFNEYLLNETRILMVGEDFRFGKDREGDTELLQKLCQKHSIEFIALNDVSLNNKRISSSWVREELHKGAFASAGNLLGRDYTITGKVLPGNQIGRRIQTPTANIEIDNYDFCFSGVFLCKVGFNGKDYFAIANFGPKPTFNDYRQSLEVNIFDFEGNLYDEVLRVVFLCKIRDQIKFESVNDLKRQIAKDIEDAKNLISNNER